ncbi:uncharacterized protein LOC121737058 [Aricia agestis]|uniref:uncharacterized protein LOC121737058 n=1 Tax=Aricia agestis TaxID=91739 RepID=UPI001C203706|nr:uncharacterized protein LOC121737058 [Aricia agestis]
MADPESILQNVLSGIAKELNYEPVNTNIKPISSEGANYTSELFEATISAADKDDINVFAKVAAVGEEMRAVTKGNMFISEIYCYTQLLKKYKELEDKYNVPTEHRLATITFYGASDEYMNETLVLDDLKKRGFEAFDRFKSIDWEYASKSLKQLAIFHALSVALSVHNPEEFERAKEVLKLEYDLEQMQGMMKNVIGNALSAVKDENKERMSQFIEEKMSAADFNDYFKSVKCPMLVHGDYRPNNLMHKFNNDGTVTVVPLDYQTCRQGSPCLDFMYFIFTGSDKKFRDQHLTSSVELYYKELCDALRRLNVDSEDVYPREDFDFEYKKFLPFGLLISIFTLFIITIEVDKAPKANKDLTLSAFDIKPNEMYIERINDIVDDFVKMGIL